MKFKNKILVAFAASAFLAVPVTASEIHTYSRTTQLGTGISYEQQRRITRAGRVDVHIIEVDLTQEGVTLGPVVTEAFGARDTTTSLLRNAGAVAGINADFFDMSRNPITAMGQVIQNGEIRELNEVDAGFATFMLDVYNSPLIEYIQPSITFLNNGNPGFSVRAYNHLSGQIVSTVFDRAAFHNTARLVERHPYLVSVVVDNGVITYISEPGEPVYIPRYGFIIAVRENYFEYFKNVTVIGNTAEIVMGAANIDLENVWQAVSGAGEVLRAGSIVNTGYVVGPNARHPRSAIGISEDGNTVFLVAVDGRGASIGATHAELGQLLLSLGAYNAMHFDGGGSTTLATRRPGADLALTNRPSDGSQRRVVNALGVFNTAPRDVLTEVELRIFPSRQAVFIGDNLNVYAVGRNAHLERLSVNSDYLEIEVYPYVQRVGNTFFPSAPGTLTFDMYYQGHVDSLFINILELARIVPSESQLSLNTGETATLTFSGLDPFGHPAPLHNINLEFFPEDFATWEEGVLSITGENSGVVRASRGAIATYIRVNVNEAEAPQVSAPSIVGNPYRRELGVTGFGFDITMVGNVSVSMFEEDELLINTNIRNEALNTFRTGATVGVFAGTSEIETVPNLATLSRQNGYRFHIIYNTALVNLDARNGSLTDTSVYNWSFVNEVRNADVENAIFMLNRPINSLTADDRAMLVNALEALVAEGFSVFIVTTGGNYNTAEIRSGVNYITLAGLFRYYEGYYEVNNAFSILRFRTSEGEIHFDVQSVFE